MKAQWVRIADVVFIGPLMIWGGLEIYKRDVNCRKCKQAAERRRDRSAGDTRFGGGTGRIIDKSSRMATDELHQLEERWLRSLDRKFDLTESPRRSRQVSSWVFANRLARRMRGIDMRRPYVDTGRVEGHGYAGGDCTCKSEARGGMSLPLDKARGVALAGLGAATMIYNARNYIAIRDQN